MYEFTYIRPEIGQGTPGSGDPRIEITLVYDDEFTIRDSLDPEFLKMEISEAVEHALEQGECIEEYLYSGLSKTRECVAISVIVTECDNREQFTRKRTGRFIPVFIGLGSNMGDKEKNLVRALEIAEREGTFIIDKAASFYITAPAGFTEQDSFLNTVVKGRTELKAEALLNDLKDIEKRLGRIWTKRNRPRTIDLDILYYGRTSMETERLVIPHKRLKSRPFVIQPLCEIAPNFRDPVTREYLKVPEGSGDILEIYKREDL